MKIENSFQAVENAFCVLVCVSEKYKESSACRSEAEYAYNLHKDVVPVMMEKGYSPTGKLNKSEKHQFFYKLISHINNFRVSRLAWNPMWHKEVLPVVQRSNNCYFKTRTT